MADNTRFKKLASIVEQFLIDNDLTNHWLNKYLSQGIRALEEINLDVTGKTIPCILPVTDRKTVVLPDDYEDYIIIGLPRGQYFVPLSINASLRLDPRAANRSDVISGLLSQHLPNGINLNSYTGYYTFDTGGGYLGVGGGGLPSKGSYRVVENGDRKEIALDYDFCGDQVYIEYITDGFDPCGETIVPAYLKDYVLKWLEDFFERKNNPKATEASRDRTGRALAAAARKVRARYNDLTPSTMLAIDRANTRLTPRM
jgi:hypothetical protein